MNFSNEFTPVDRQRISTRTSMRGAISALALLATVGVTILAPSAAAPATALPLASASVYGPDGTHWPTNTPRTDGGRVVNVAASWSAISAAIVANASSADPVVICVAPGTISGGNGERSSSSGVLQNIGNSSRASRILVAACGGVGSVKVASGSGIAFVGVKGVSIVGIDFSAQSLMIRNSESFAVGYSKVPRLLVTANGGNGVRDVEIVEIVAGPEASNGSAYDRAEVKSAGGFSVNGLRFVGFYAAPNYKPKGSSAHCDTVQFVTTTGNGKISNVSFEDSAVFQSGDQGVMAGGNEGGAITHSAFFGGTTGQLRYPIYAGGDPIRLSNLLHGGWSNVSASGVIVAGSISPSYSFSSVNDSSSTAGRSGFTSLGSLTLADIDRLAPMPTDARLASLWKSAVGPGQNVPVPPVPTPPVTGPAVPTPPATGPAVPTPPGAGSSAWLGGSTGAKSCTLKGGVCYKPYEGGWIVQGPAGTHPVPMTVLQMWGSYGRSSNVLGFPASAPSADPTTGSYSQAFQGGVITVTNGVAAATLN